MPSFDPLQSVMHSPQTCHSIRQRKVSSGLARSPAATLSKWVQVMVGGKSPKLRSFCIVRAALPCPSPANDRNYIQLAWDLLGAEAIVDVTITFSHQV